MVTLLLAVALLCDGNISLMNEYIVPFATPVDYFDLCNRDPENFRKLETLVTQAEIVGDSDLHVYPYTRAKPAMLSAGCPNKCSFCPTAKAYKGQQYFGDEERIIPLYQNRCVHFMDENFFYHPRLDNILRLLKRSKIEWLCLSDATSLHKTIDRYGEDYLLDCGLRIVEVGLENTELKMKVKQPFSLKKIQIYYLNMTFFPGETIQTIRKNAGWMMSRSLSRPIHFTNSLWYSPGQYYYPQTNEPDGVMLPGKYARTMPTFVPDSFLDQTFEVTNLEMTNYYATLQKIPKQIVSNGLVREFIGNDQNKASWLAIAARVSGIR